MGYKYRTPNPALRASDARKIWNQGKTVEETALSLGPNDNTAVTRIILYRGHLYNAERRNHTITIYQVRA